MAGTTVMAKAPPRVLIRYRAPAVLASTRGEAPVTESISVVSPLVLRAGARYRGPRLGGGAASRTALAADKDRGHRHRSPCATTNCCQTYRHGTTAKTMTTTKQQSMT